MVEKYSDGTSRRNAIKMIGSAGAVAAVPSLFARDAAAAEEGDSWDGIGGYDYDLNGTHVKGNLGGALVLTNVSRDDKSEHDDPLARYMFEVCADFVVIEPEKGDMPVTESEGYGDGNPDDDRNLDYPANRYEGDWAADYQEIKIERQDDNTIQFGMEPPEDGDMYMHPVPQDGSSVADFGGGWSSLSTASSALSLAMSAAGISGSGALGAAGLAASLMSQGDDYNMADDDQVVLSEQYYVGFFRASNHAKFQLTVEPGESGQFKVTELFKHWRGRESCQTSWTIFADYDNVSVYG
ncbi:hypothetical protein [Halosimplex carlsbadense]|uniref:hypothetical protein n=1 Tax=Halosimplex carlsbadense TaxID=171164 RepID=UPI0012686DB4|nr:hypothetical protein [Halosimplex carlsbadense]